MGSEASPLSLAGRHVLLGVTGSIAAYKAAVLLREMVREGASVQCLMTAAARRFIGPLTLEVLSGRPVASNLFASEEADIQHIEVGRAADLAMVAPATASFLARHRAGLVKDMLDNALLALDRDRVPLLVAPAMNGNMWHHPATQENAAMLRRWGVHIVPPERGELACKVWDEGRLAQVPRLLQHARMLLYRRDRGAPLRGRRVVVTAGPTREAIDPVRFLSNPSTGSMGRAVALAAWVLGADVTLLAGPGVAEGPFEVDRRSFSSHEDLAAGLAEALPGADILVMSAAVADYRPAHQAAEKIKKAAGPMQLNLDRTLDLLVWVNENFPRIARVGFAAETGDVTSRARGKLFAKGLDLIVGNLVGRPGTGFGAAATEAVLIDREGNERPLGSIHKEALAFALLERLIELRPELVGHLADE